MSGPQDGVAGFVGPLGDRAGLLNAGLGAGLLTRWDRWWELASRGAGPLPLDPDRPVWRVLLRAGLLAPEPVAGAFRLGRDRLGLVHPFAVLRAGPPPDPSDPWFDAAAALAMAATEGGLGLPALRRGLDRLPRPATVTPEPDGAAVFWRDDWVVREVALAEPADLLRFPVRAAARGDPPDLAA